MRIPKTPREILLAPIERTPRWLRTVLYSSLLALLLAYLSYRLVYSSPSQVSRRVQGALEEMVRARVVVGACERRWGRGTHVESVEISTARATQTQQVLGLLDIWVDPAQEAAWEIDPPPRASFPRPDQLGPAAPGAMRLRAREASIFLRHRSDGSPGEWSRGWDLSEVVRGAGLERALREQAVDLQVRGGSVHLLETRPDGRQIEHRLSFDRFQLRSDAAGWWLGVEIPASAHWDPSRVEAAGSHGGAVEVSAALENFRPAAVWIELLPSPWRELWRDLQPAGAFNVEWRWRRNAAGEAPEVALILESFDSTLRLPPRGLEVRRVRGRMRLDPGGILLGGSRATGGGDPLPPQIGEVWGMRCELRGSLGRDGGEIQLALPRTRLEQIPAAGPPEPLAWFLESFRPVGVIDDVRAELSPKTGDWSLVAAARDLSPAGAPAWILGEGRLEASGSGAPPPASSAVLALLDLRWEGFLGAIAGRIAIEWDKREWRVRTPPDAEGQLRIAAPRELASQPPAPVGTLSLSCRGGMDRSFLEGECAWAGVSFHCALASGQSGRGSLRWGRSAGRVAPGEEPAPAAPAAAASPPEAAGEADLEALRVPPGVLGGAAIGFAEGRAEWRVRRGAVEILPLRLAGAGVAARACGRISFAGQIDILCLISRGPSSRELYELAPDSPVAQWVEAAGPALEAYRLAGTASAPISRAIVASDIPFEQPLPAAAR
ncbi:MAG: hypothetical protein JXA90_01720 [Planctomycetes bacterium]|nr:hypothetical protein [Planctomycetota bacterium]